MNTQEIEDLKNDTIETVDMLAGDVNNIAILRMAIIKLAEEAQSAQRKVTHLETTTFSKHHDKAVGYIDVARQMLYEVKMQFDFTDDKVTKLIDEANDTLGCAWDRLS